MDEYNSFLTPDNEFEKNFIALTMNMKFCYEKPPLQFATSFNYMFVYNLKGNLKLSKKLLEQQSGLPLLSVEPHSVTSIIIFFRSPLKNYLTVDGVNNPDFHVPQGVKTILRVSREELKQLDGNS